MPSILSPEQLTRDLALRDLTDPAGGDHAVQRIVDRATAACAAAWDCEVRVVRGPRVVPLEDNYDRLLYPSAAVTRDARYTRYVDENHVLRSHTTAMIPGALAALAGAGLDDVVLACPGITYRRDSIDRLHTATPHQLDLWRISRGPLVEADLEAMIAALGDAVAPGRPLRSEPRIHPYTLAGRQVDARWDGEWIEVWECGLAHPELLRREGLDGYSGLALGMGLDRLVMLHKSIPDIRLLRASDERVASQMADLEEFRPVSDLPAIRRDLSLAVPLDDDVETLGDRVRDALGQKSDLVEEVAVLAQTPYGDVPNVARGRLGMSSEQKNVLLRVVLRPVDRTLTDAEANALRDAIYVALHRGTVSQWAGR